MSMKLLVHICCGPCSIIPFKHLFDKGEGYVCGFFFNPNIHPYTEYMKRLDSVKKLAELMGFDVIYSDDYRMEEFLLNVAKDPDNRCEHCYRSRLEETAQAAKENGFSSFTTSLLYSRYQKHERIKEVGEEVGGLKGIPFFYHDFRYGWKDGIALSKDMGLYRQQYCGCIYSEKERYYGRKK